MALKYSKRDNAPSIYPMLSSKTSVLEIGYIFLSICPNGYHRLTQTLQTIASVIGYFPQPDNKILLLKHYLLMSSDMEKSSWWPLLFTVLEGTLYASGEQNQSSLSLNHESNNPSKRYIGTIVVQKFWG